MQALFILLAIGGIAATVAMYLLKMSFLASVKPVLDKRRYYPPDARDKKSKQLLLGDWK